MMKTYGPIASCKQKNQSSTWTLSGETHRNRQERQAHQEVGGPVGANRQRRRRGSRRLVEHLGDQEPRDGTGTRSEHHDVDEDQDDAEVAEFGFGFLKLQD